MSEMAVLVIRIRKEQASDYEQLFAESELPRWRDYHERGLFKQARIFRSGFGSHETEGIANNDPGFQEFNRKADAFQPEDPFVFGGEPIFSVG